MVQTLTPIQETTLPRADVAKRPAAGGVSVYEAVQRQFDKAANLIRLDSAVRKILSVPMNEIVIHFPVRMDDGRVEMLTGYRVQHNNALGPFKGGLRFHPALE
jgi:glutamate dehydrogenase (NAD(P)+)